MNPMPRSPSPARSAPSAPRGILTGIATAALAVGAHGFAGGGYPDSTGLMLLLLAAGTVGALAATTRSRAALPALMVLGQPAGHLALTGLAHHGHADRDRFGSGTSESILSLLGIPHTGGGLSAGAAMTAAHTGAGIACALLILLAERLYTLISRAIRAVLTHPAVLPAPAPIRRPATAWNPKTLPALGATGPRAPPVPA